MMSSPSLLTKGLKSTFSQTRILPHDIVKVYQCVNDIPKYPEFIHGIKRARIISSSNVSGNPNTDDLLPTNKTHTVTFAELQIDIVAMQIRYMSRVISIPCRSIEAKCLNSLIFKNLHTKWNFSPVSDSETMVNFHVEFEFKNSIYGTALSPIFSKMTQTTMKSFEERMSKL